jgi:hypothetical protein
VKNVHRNFVSQWKHKIIINLTPYINKSLLSFKGSNLTNIKNVYHIKIYTQVLLLYNCTVYHCQTERFPDMYPVHYILSRKIFRGIHHFKLAHVSGYGIGMPCYVTYFSPSHDTSGLFVKDGKSNYWNSTAFSCRETCRW